MLIGLRERLAGMGAQGVNLNGMSRDVPIPKQLGGILGEIFEQSLAAGLF